MLVFATERVTKHPVLNKVNTKVEKNVLSAMLDNVEGKRRIQLSDTLLSTSKASSKASDDDTPT